MPDGRHRLVAVVFKRKAEAISFEIASAFVLLFYTQFDVTAAALLLTVCHAYQIIQRNLIIFGQLDCRP